MAKYIKLEIGVGGNKKGWLTLDANLFVKPNIVDDATKLRKIKMQCCTEIFCSHILEHIHECDIVNTLIVWRKRLLKGGKLTVYVPDCEEAWRQRFDSRINDDTLLGVMIGSKPDRNFLLHKTFFWFSRLEKIVHSAGFRHITKLPSRGKRIEFGIQARKIAYENFTIRT